MEHEPVEGLMHPSRRILYLVVLTVAALSGGCERKREQPKKSLQQRRSISTKVKRKVDRRKPPRKGLLPEKGPHPDFPTPRLARTEKIFLLEEPDRGPVVTTASVPDEQGLRWSSHDHCEIDHDRAACGPAARSGKLPGARRYWRVGRRAGRAVLVREHFGPRVEATLILEWAQQKGSPQRMIQLDALGTVEWSRHFVSGGIQYSSRRLNGSNALAGCGYIRLERRGEGPAQRVTCLQWSGAPMHDTSGVVTTELKRDRRGFVVSKRMLGKEGKPVADHHGVHREVIRRDASGRVVSRRYYDLEGFPVLSLLQGCFGWRYRLTPRGLLQDQICLDAQGRPMTDTVGVCRYSYAYDGRGCRTAVLDYGLTKDKGRTCGRLFKRIAYEVSPRCQHLVKYCEDGEDKRVRCKTGHPAEYRYRRDEEGRVISVRQFGPDRQPAGDPNCKAFERRNRWDERGNLAAETYHGVAGQPVECSKTGYHGVLHAYDEAGRSTEDRFIDVKGKPGTNLGCAVRTFRYDNYDHLVESINHDAGGQVIEVLGMSYRKTIYDEGHRVFGFLLFDKGRKPAAYRGCFTGRTCPPRPWHAVRVMRRPNGSVSSNLFFDRDGQLIHTVDCGKHLCWK